MDEERYFINGIENLRRTLKSMHDVGRKKINSRTELPADILDYGKPDGKIDYEEIIDLSPPRVEFFRWTPKSPENNKKKEKTKEGVVDA
ncbi:MAG: hypothetical protein QW727_03380 [Candidatus Pacearchaeota archaeon]